MKNIIPTQKDYRNQKVTPGESNELWLPAPDGSNELIWKYFYQSIAENHPFPCRIKKAKDKRKNRQ